jgi:hypothetical protein
VSLADAPQPDEPPVVDKLELQPTAGIPADITAATVDEFVQNSNAKMGGTGAVGHMQPDIDPPDLEWEGTGRATKVTKVHMVVKTSIVRPRWAGGHPKPSADEEKLIKKAVQLIKEHEERHRKICEDNMTEAFKKMHGQTKEQAAKTFEDFKKKMDNEQKALDAKEGGLQVEHKGPKGSAGPATDVVLGPAPP